MAMFVVILNPRKLSDLKGYFVKKTPKHSSSWK